MAGIHEEGERSTLRVIRRTHRKRASIIVLRLMLASRLGCVLALLAALCVVALFFFPASQGPYSAVYGPVTALLSARAAVGVRSAIVQAGLSAVGWAGYGNVFLLASGAVVGSQFSCLDRHSAGSDLILRC